MVHQSGILPPSAIVRRIDGVPGAGRLRDPAHYVAVAPVLLLRVDAVLALVKVAEQLGPVPLVAVPPEVVPVTVTG